MILPAVANSLSTGQTLPTAATAAALMMRGGAVPTAISSSALVDFCANAAPLASMLIFFAPYPTISQVAKDKNVGSLPLLPYSSMVANCIMWTVYGILKQEIKIWGTNGIGIAFGLFYFLRFIKFAPPKAPSFPGSILQHVSACVAAVVASGAITAFLPTAEAANIMGNLAVLLCIAMFGSPLASLKTVLQTRSAKSIPLPFTVATCLNCLFWSVAGIFQMKDAKVYFPNVIGLAFGVTQVTLKLLFGDGTSGLEKEKALM